MYKKEDFTWGYEVEWGDINRTLNIPKHLGKWEYAETDIVNIREPYKFIATDPLGISPNFGGEINMMPTKTWQEQVNNILELKRFFSENGCDPSSSCVNHGHLHVFVPRLKEDINALKSLISYIKSNQSDTIASCYGFTEHPDMKKHKAKMYLKYDGGREMPEYMCDNILNKSSNFKDFIRLHCAGKDGVSMGRPFRYAINTYCMKHTGTIEFRCFRSSTDEEEITSQFKFVEKFIDSALNGGPSVKEILSSDSFKFPPFIWSEEEYSGWIATKWPKERGKKVREYVSI